MFERLIVAVASATPTSEPAAQAAPASGKGVAASVSDVVTTVFDNLGNNGYQTGIALVVATAAVIGMLNIEVHRAVIAPVALGAFWAGWLGWNSLTGQNNPLFPGDVSATKIWDIAFDGDTGFLVAAMIACVAAFFLWRKGTALTSRLWLLLGAVLGASFLFNLVEAVRVS